MCLVYLCQLHALMLATNENGMEIKFNQFKSVFIYLFFPHLNDEEVYVQRTGSTVFVLMLNILLIFVLLHMFLWNKFIYDG